MSSEYSIHLGSKAIKGRVDSLSPALSCTVIRLTVDAGDGDPCNREQFVLFVKGNRLLETAHIFHDIAGRLAMEYVPDTLPTEDAAEAVEPPHRWG